MPFFCLSIISVGHFCCQLMTTVVRRPTGREALRAWETGNSQEMQIFEWKIPKKSCWSVKRQLKYCIILYPAHNIYIYIYSCFLIICWEINDVPCTSCTLWFFFFRHGFWGLKRGRDPKASCCETTLADRGRWRRAIGAIGARRDAGTENGTGGAPLVKIIGKSQYTIWDCIKVVYKALVSF